VRCLLEVIGSPVLVDIGGEMCPPSLGCREAGPLSVEVLIPRASQHPGAGTAIIDGALSENFLMELDSLWRRLTLARKEKASPAERAYFADTLGWVARELRDAIAAAGLSEVGDVLPLMRFLHYPEPGGRLPPHVDLRRWDEDTGSHSSHTFLVYLTDSPEGGGETVLLDSRPGDELLSKEGGLAPGPRQLLAKASPKRGRIMVMPHACPHEAFATSDGNKRLLRGELLPKRGEVLPKRRDL